MKRILAVTTVLLLTSTVNASVLQANAEQDKDAHVFSKLHQTHHADAKQTLQHEKKHQDEIFAAHLHDHQGNVNQAEQHVKDHNGSVALAHDHDHEYDSASSEAHSHDHGLS